MSTGRRYVVSQEEMDSAGKSPLTAMLWAFFLGGLGAHRFYLKRPRSGAFIIGISVISAGLALLVTIPLGWIEAMYYMYIASKQAPRAKQPQTAVAAAKAAPAAVTQDGLLPGRSESHPAPHQQEPIPQVIRQIISDFKPAAPVTPSAVPTPSVAHVTAAPAVATRTENQGIYDISDIEPSPVQAPPPADTTNSPPAEAAGEWIALLQLPYERRNLRIPLLKTSVYTVYAQLADYVDHELKKRQSSLSDLVQRLASEHSYYDNVLYTIFCIAEGHVTEHYSGGRHTYDNSFSYQLLTRRLGAKFVEGIRAQAQAFTAQLPPADDDVKRIFGLAHNGLPLIWWDMDGYLREHNAVNDTQARILSATPQRSTKLFEIPEVRLLIFRHYFKALATLRSQRHEAANWKVWIGKYLDKVFDGHSYIDNPRSFLILNHILKLSEQAIREQLPYARPLATDNEITLLRRTIPPSAADAVIATIAHIDEPLHLSTAATQALIAANPNAWKHDLIVVEQESIHDIVRILQRYTDAETRAKMAKEIARKHPDAQARLAAIYAAQAAGGIIDEPLRKKLAGLIHPEQMPQYEALVAAKHDISLAIVQQLQQLTQAPHRRVVLDDRKIKEAHQDHNRAVHSVDAYLEENEVANLEDAHDPQITEVKDDQLPAGIKPQPEISRDALFSATPPPAGIAFSADQKEFLHRIIIQADGLDATEAAAFARAQGKMLNGFIQAINKVWYETYEDQVIVQSDGKIVIAAEYRETVKEFI